MGKETKQGCELPSDCWRSQPNYPKSPFSSSSVVYCLVTLYKGSAFWRYDASHRVPNEDLSLATRAPWPQSSSQSPTPVSDTATANRKSWLLGYLPKHCQPGSDSISLGA